MLLYEDMSPTARVAKITYVLVQDGRLTAARIKEMAGYKSMEGVRQVMNKISLTIPVYQPEPGVWELLDGRRTDYGAIEDLQ